MADAGFGAGLQLHSNHYSDQLSQQRMEILGAQLGKIGISIKSTVAAVAQANQQWHDGVGDIHLSADRAGRSKRHLCLAIRTGRLLQLRRSRPLGRADTRHS